MAASSPDYSEYRDTEPREDALLRLARLAHAQREAEEAVEKAQAALQAAQDQLREISQQQIPALMDSVEMKTYTTKDGVSISIQEKLRVSVPKDRKDQAMDWVEAHGGAALVKRAFTILFGKGDEKWAAKFERDMAQRKKPLECARSKDVHSSTLKKFLEDQLEAGTAVPLELFGGYHQREAVVEVKVKKG